MHMLPPMLASFNFLCIIFSFFILYMVLSTGRTTAPSRSLASPTYYADWQIPYAMHHTTTFSFISLHTQASDLLRFTSFICTFCALPTHRIPLCILCSNCPLTMACARCLYGPSDVSALLRSLTSPRTYFLSLACSLPDCAMLFSLFKAGFLCCVYHAVRCTSCTSRHRAYVYVYITWLTGCSNDETIVMLL
ncbi:uncharacterized protein SCHCODRAFT_02111967 [Schizophyllum commune H4-8]|uniref:uncharacterized protein n=1 Tax=Schizophyllum commune (strain H4-8 / FGSC 9210) TaxID=578458 RepID=UPI00216078A6|nr:uncharacterized protein SCHCODRAFT_02111967 [Schizophyllum commune H4-8]KAI5886087.1 hypothetical protein SCHCODRAFT_02111967 [Schizophyllum commune H4-8]